MAAFNGKNVLFLQGTQLDLNKMMSNSTDVSKRGTAQEGAFYLTNDTHRLYIGRTAEDGKTYPVAVNEGVVTVESVDKLPSSGVNVGEFYYVTTGNILCVYSGSGFVQINSDTDSNSYITAIDTPTITSNAEGITVSFNILQKDVDKNGDEVAEGKHIGKDFLASVPVSFTIAKTHLDTVLPDNIAVGLDAEAITNGGAKLSTTGAGSDATNIVNLKQGDNITISVSGDDVTIAAKDDDTKYDLVGIANAEKGQIQLQAKDGSENDDVYFETGNDALTVASTATGVTYTHKEYETTEGSNTAKPVTHKGKFTVIDGITTDKGHVTAWTSKEIELPEDQNTYIVKEYGSDNNKKETKIEVSSNVAGGNGKGSLVIDLVNNNGDTVTARADDVLYHKITVDGTEATVYNQNSLGSFYSANKIDQLMQGVNAMTYKGPVDKANPLPSTDVKIGDTYKVAEAGTYNGQECKLGDLLIATGEEENGVISGTITWTYIPSGDDTDTQYSISVGGVEDAATVILHPSTNTGDDSVTIAGGTTINVALGTDSITINHENVTRNDGDKLDDETPAHDGTGRVTVVDSVVTNDQGHVTAVKTKDIVIPADANTTYDLAGNNNKIILTAYNGTTSSGSDEITVTDDDKYIEATVTNNELKIAHKSYTAETLSAAAGQATELAHGGNFTVLTGVTRDDGGHIDGVTSSTWTLPQDQNTTYTMSDHVVSAKTVENGSGATITTTLDGYNGDTKSSTNTANFDITSTSLKIEADATNGVVAVNMVWGSFGSV